MTLASDDYNGARRLFAELLSELGVEDYTFAIEPAAEGWRVHVECATDDGWQSSELLLDHETFGAADTAEEARMSTLSTLEARLSACRRRR